jgi:hypothetical protein
MSDRLALAFSGAVAAVIPPRLWGVYEFEVVSGDSAACDLVPTDPSVGLPEMVQVPSWVSPAGEIVTYAPGVHVLLAFVNGLPSRPVVVSSDASAPALEVELRASTTFKINAPSVTIEASGSCTVNSPMVSLGAGASLPVAYQGSAAVCGPFAGAVTLGSVTVKTTP